MSDVTLPFTLFPIIVVSTLSVILHDMSHLIALLICMLLAHNNIIATDTTSIAGGDFQCEIIILLTYVPVILSIAEARMSKSSHSLSQIFSRNPAFKIGFRSMIPASLTLIYGSVIMMIKMKPIMQERQFLQYQIAIFILFWATYTILSYLKRRKSYPPTRNAAFLMMGAENFNRNLAKPDERNWEYWNTLQCINWVKYNYRDRCDDIDGDVMEDLLQAIRSQRIRGASLPHLGVDDFRSIGVSYGDSVIIFHDICELIHNYPSRNRNWDKRSLDREKKYRREDSRVGSADKGIDLDAWLGKKIGQTEITTEDDDDEEVSRRAQVSDRHGGTTNMPQDLPTPQHASTPIPDADGIFSNTSAASVAKMPDTSTNTQLDEALLNAMPPKVREIAARRPDLVQALLASKNGSMKASISTPDDISNAFHQGDEKSFASGNDAEADNTLVEHDLYSIDEESNDEEGGWFSHESNDHEMLGLLRRRGKTE